MVEAAFADSSALLEAHEAGVDIFVFGGMAETARAQWDGFETEFADDLDVTRVESWMQAHANEKPLPRPTLQRSGDSLPPSNDLGKVAVFAGLLPTGGGVGKDTFSFNVAAWLSRQGQDVALVELDPFGTLVDKLGVTPLATVDLWLDAQEEPTEATIRRTLSQTSFGFSILAASATHQLLPEEAVLRITKGLRRVYDVLILNLGSGQTSGYYASLGVATHLYLMGQGDRGKFRVYRRVLDELVPQCAVTPKVVLNRHYDKDAAGLWEDEFGGVPPFVSVLEDARVFGAMERGDAVGLKMPKRPFGAAVKTIGEDILGHAVETKKGGGRLWPF